MADKNNSGQFGNRSDTEEQARKGGEQSTGKFGEKNAADPSEAAQQSTGRFGQKNAADPSEAAQQSTGRFGQKNAADPSEAGRQGAEAQPHAAKVEGGKHSHDGN